MFRLYQCFGIDPEEKGAPTRLGTAMDASPQTVTNWAERGVSRDGALAAERLTGCSAAWILDGKALAYVPGVATTTVVAREPVPLVDYGWPFRKISRAQWATVDDDTRERVEAVILAMIRPPGPEKQQEAHMEEAWH